MDAPASYSCSKTRQRPKRLQCLPFTDLRPRFPCPIPTTVPIQKHQACQWHHGYWRSPQISPLHQPTRIHAFWLEESTLWNATILPNKARHNWRLSNDAWVKPVYHNFRLFILRFHLSSGYSSPLLVLLALNL